MKPRTKTPSAKAPAGDESTFTMRRLRNATVVVVSGGRSGEREVSLRSGAAIANALIDAADGRGPASVAEVEIGADGSWLMGGLGFDPLGVMKRLPPDAVWFLGLHGGDGEDGTLQGFLTTLGRIHTGSGVGASALCMSKTWTREVLRGAGIAVAPGVIVDAHAWSTDRDRLLSSIAALGNAGVAVKPDRGGSSVATTLVRADGGKSKPAEIAEAIESALAVDDRAVVEARIVGVEATCGVLGNPRSGLRALMPVEIVPKDGRFFDYEEKYSAGGAAEHCPPVSLDAQTCQRIQSAAVRACQAAGCEGYARVDFMIPAGTAPEPVVLEINTLPGMTDRSLLPLAAAQAGMSFRDLCLEILRLALERRRP